MTRYPDNPDKVDGSALRGDSFDLPERFWRQLFSNSADAIFVHRFDGVVVDANCRALEMTGRTLENLAGRHLADLMTAESLPEVERGMLKTFERGFHRYEASLELEGSRTIEVEICTSVVALEETLMQSTFRNQTGRRLEEEERTGDERERATREYVARLKQKNRELEQLVYAATHDLRSPLVNIQGFGHELASAIDELQTLLDDTTGVIAHENSHRLLTREIPECLNFVISATGKMDSLLSGILEVSRTGRNEVRSEIVDMNRVAGKAWADAQERNHAAGGTIEVKNLPSCQGDSPALHMALVHILSNALQCCASGRTPAIVVRGRTVGRFVAYSVADNGPGIEPEHLGNIFNLFHRLDPGRPGGPGIGLTVVRMLVERLSGKVEVESEVGVGTTLTLVLPAPRAHDACVASALRYDDM